MENKININKVSSSGISKGISYFIHNNDNKVTKSKL